MSEKRSDRRITKTRDALATALLTLIEQEDWSAISIQKICDKADVARASFYAHFDSKIHLLEATLNRNLGGLAAHIHALGRGGFGVLEWFVEHVTSSRSRFARIVLSSEAHQALARFKTIVAEQMREALKIEGIAASETQIQFIMGGTMELLTVWAKNWRLQEVEKLKSDVVRFAESIVKQGS